MKRIQSKILFVVVSTLVVITVLVTSIAITITHEIMHRDADIILDNMSQKEAAQINEMLNDFVKSAQIIKHHTTNELKSTKALKDDTYLDEYMEQVRHLYDEIAINTSGTYSYYLCLSPDLVSIPTGFYTQFETDGSIYELSKSEFSGLTIITGEELIEYSNSTGSASGEWVAPHPSRFTGEPVISYIMPLYKEDTFFGLLGFNMKFDYLLQRVDQISVYESGCALLLGEDGKGFYNSTEHKEYEDEYTEAITPLANGMSLELHTTYKDIQRNLRPMLSYIIGAFLLVLVLAIIFTFWVTRRIVGPLNKLIAATADIGSGTEDINLLVDSDDEIGLLSRVLNDAYGKIREYSAYINALAYKDALTGLKNRTAYSEAVEEINREIKNGEPVFGVMVADVNYLKKANDTYGHEAGNELLIRTSKVLTETFKTSSVFRIGGDEFAVILRGTEVETYGEMIENLKKSFLSTYITVHDGEIPVSVAMGISIFDSSKDQTYEDVFDKADQAMYLDKTSMKVIR